MVGANVTVGRWSVLHVYSNNMYLFINGGRVATCSPSSHTFTVVESQ